MKKLLIILICILVIGCADLTNPTPEKECTPGTDFVGYGYTTTGDSAAVFAGMCVDTLYVPLRLP